MWAVVGWTITDREEGEHIEDHDHSEGLQQEKDPDAFGLGVREVKLGVEL